MSEPMALLNWSIVSGSSRAAPSKRCWPMTVRKHASRTMVELLALIAGTGSPRRRIISGVAPRRTFEPIIVKAHAQAMADQARGHRVEHPLEDEPARPGNGDDRLLVIPRPARRQRLYHNGAELR
jgi:hypothetical protein